MPAGEISFELDRFEWASPDRLEVEGTWHGVRRRLPRATLVVEVDGTRRRLRALPDASASAPERWAAAFPWEGEMPRLPGAELELGRGIVVDLPRPRRSKARSAAPADPLPASSRDEREAEPGREEVDRLLAVLTSARTDADEAAGRAAAAEAEAETLRERAEAAEAELATTDAAELRTRAEAAEAEVANLRARAETAEADLAAADVSTLRSGLEEAQAELGTLRSRAEHAEAEVETLQSRAEAAEADAADLPALRLRLEDAENEVEELRVRAEQAEAELPVLLSRAEDAETALAARQADDAPAGAPGLDRLRAELETVERERIELRAQLDATAERLEAAEAETRALREGGGTAPMPSPRTAAAGQAGARPARRPAERTARRTDTTTAEPAAPPLGERITEWVTSLTGSRDEPQNGRTDVPKPADAPTSARSAARTERTRSAQGVSAATRTRRRSDPRHAADQGSPSWILRAAAVGLLLLLMVALLVIVLSLL